MESTERKEQGPATEDLMRGILAVVGRAVFPEERLRELVGSYDSAYNLCTGANSLSAIARDSGCDKSNLHKVIVKWQQAGIVLKIQSTGFPLHLYALPIEGSKVRPPRHSSRSNEVEHEGS